MVNSNLKQNQMCPQTRRVCNVHGHYCWHCVAHLMWWRDAAAASWGTGFYMCPSQHQCSGIIFACSQSTRERSECVGHKCGHRVAGLMPLWWHSVLHLLQTSAIFLICMHVIYCNWPQKQYISSKIVFQEVLCGHKCGHLVAGLVPLHRLLNCAKGYSTHPPTSVLGGAGGLHRQGFIWVPEDVSQKCAIF